MGSKKPKTNKKHPEIGYHISAVDRTMNKLDAVPALIYTSGAMTTVHFLYKGRKNKELFRSHLKVTG